MTLRAPAGIDVIEYPGRAERSLLVCAGTGLMLSLMDQCTRLRWCVDADGLSPDQQAQFRAWLPGAAAKLHLIAFAGWYCSTNPEEIAATLRMITGRRVLVYAQCHGPRQDEPFDDLWTAFSLGELVEQIQNSPVDPVERAIEESGAVVGRLTWAEYLGQ
jgi:hypothetical protein